MLRRVEVVGLMEVVGGKEARETEVYGYGDY